MDATHIEKRTLEWHDGRPSVVTAERQPLGAGEVADLLEAERLGGTRGAPELEEGAEVVYRYDDKTFVRDAGHWLRVLWTF